ncbi:MAG: aminoglycoside phosphotransferase family protein [Firmicutes bacterium]|nr:aminoglycoside phosphotransferase family protein [Bacillota bacterium]
MIRITAAFAAEGRVSRVREHGMGHIHRSYRVTMEEGEEYLLQQINTLVFQNVPAMTENLVKVTDLLQRKAAERGEDPDKTVLSMIPARAGGYVHQEEDGSRWRLFRFIPGVSAGEDPDNLSELEQAGEAIGQFLTDVSDLPPDSLQETIPHFHDTPYRYYEFRNAIEWDSYSRVSEVEPEIGFILQRSKGLSVVANALQEGRLPYRTAHNDTKINNVLVDPESGRRICMVDLDTVMKGSSLFDFGDAIRSGAAVSMQGYRIPASGLDLKRYEAITGGFMRTARHILTDAEIEMLPRGAWLMTMECGIRFLTDYLQGDRYFRIYSERQNLERAQSQFMLALDMERKHPDMDRILKQYR